VKSKSTITLWAFTPRGEHELRSLFSATQAEGEFDVKLNRACRLVDMALAELAEAAQIR
jgi:hypothetical protein